MTGRGRIDASAVLPAAADDGAEFVAVGDGVDGVGDGLAVGVVELGDAGGDGGVGGGGGGGGEGSAGCAVDDEVVEAGVEGFGEPDEPADGGVRRPFSYRESWLAT